MTGAAGSRYDPRLYVRVAADLRKKISEGVLAAGDTVSITYTAQEWGIARQTVSKALRSLERDGLLKRYPGVGFFVQAQRADSEEDP
jgi:DNA-binding GntR family transcriptional regulator